MENSNRVVCSSSTCQSERSLAFDVWLYTSLPRADMCPALPIFLVDTDVELKAFKLSVRTCVKASFSCFNVSTENDLRLYIIPKVGLLKIARLLVVRTCEERSD